MTVDATTAEVTQAPRSFDELSAKYSQPLRAKLVSENGESELFDQAQAVWANPDDKQVLRPGKFRAISLQARAGLLDRGMDEAVAAVTGLFRVDIVVVTNEGIIFKLESGWDFAKQKVTIEGAQVSETGNTRGEGLSVATADKFLGQWLGR